MAVVATIALVSNAGDGLVEVASDDVRASVALFVELFPLLCGHGFAGVVNHQKWW